MEIFKIPHHYIVIYDHFYGFGTVTVINGHFMGPAEFYSIILILCTPHLPLSIIQSYTVISCAPQIVLQKLKLFFTIIEKKLSYTVAHINVSHAHITILNTASIAKFD